jgi:Holliday junction DNA helicase RuvA
LFAHFDGIVAEKNADSIVLDVNGVGYLLFVSGATLSMAPAVGERMKLYSALNVREDAMELFGFCSKDEKDMFKRLISVSGIGAKSALAVLGSMPLSDLRLAILTGDAAALSRAPGIGKKTAQRISLELKDKLTQDALSFGGEEAVAFVPADASGADPVSEAILALQALGYTPQEAANALKGVKGQADTVDGLIKLALRHMVQNG